MNLAILTILFVSLLSGQALSGNGSPECRIEATLLQQLQASENQVSLDIIVYPPDERSCNMPMELAHFKMEIPFNFQDDRIEYTRYITSKNLLNGVVFKTKFGGDSRTSITADMSYRYGDQSRKLQKPRQFGGAPETRYLYSADFECKMKCA